MSDDKEKTREDKSKSGIIREQMLKDKTAEANKYKIKANEGEGRRYEGGEDTYRRNVTNSRQ